MHHVCMIPRLRFTFRCNLARVINLICICIHAYIGLRTYALQPDFDLLWSPISPLGHQGGLSGARTAARQKRAFSIVGPSVWNDLPSELRSLPRDLSSSFYKLLKTLLFGRAWAGSAS